MANMLYNGVELPALPTLKDGFDAETWCCWAIYKSNAYGHALWVTKTAVEYTSGYISTTSNGRILYKCADGDTEWTYVNDISSAASDKYAKGLVWSNVDVYTAGDSSTLYLAASEPVDPNAPAEPETPHITISSGDGFALYNGIKLPKLPEWDAAAYPYAYLFYADASDIESGAYILSLCASAEQVAIGDETDGKMRFNPTFLHCTLTNSQVVCDVYAEYGLGDLTVNVWDIFEAGYWTEPSTLPIWANVDVCYTDGSVYLAASAPLPLDGMTVIEWDGVTDGNSIEIQAGYSIQRIGDYLPTDTYGGFVTSNTATDSKLITMYGSPSGSYSSIPDSYTAEASIFENDSWLVSYRGDELDLSFNALLSVNGSLPMSESITISDGLWAPVIGVNGNIAVYTPLVAYRSNDTPSEPTYDRTAFLSGMAMGLCGKGYPAGANGHMSYNGIELADISSIWTDKSNHVFICKAVNSYFAIVSTVAPYQDSVNGGVSLSAPFYFKQYGCFTDEAAANEYGTTAYTWTFYQEHSLDEGVSNFDQTVIWTSTDIRKDSDGSIFLAASEPIPTGGIGGDDDFTKGYLVGAELRRKRG